MIKLLGFKKKYFNKTILEFKKVTFDQTGFYLIYGRSGCGKTTLLNCISLLEDFDGDYILNGINIKNISDDEKAKIRKELISYVHQKPVLLNDFSVFENIKLFSNLKDGEILNYLSLFNLKEKAHQPVKTLSGGEMQRISLIKSIVLEKPIILADEPTGALDKKNAIFVLNKLKELSKNHLVIVVSHDATTFKEVADEVIHVKNDSIEIEKEKEETINLKKSFYTNSTFDEKKINKRYSKHIVKKKKVKNFLVSLFTGLSLMCVSLTLLIGINVKDELVNGFSQFYEPNQIVIKNRSNANPIFKKNSPTEKEIQKIYSMVSTEKPRIYYANNFETFFKDANSLHLVTKYKTVRIEGFSSRHFNEFKPINSANHQYFSKNELKMDEIILSIDNPLMLELCYQLSIPKTFNSLFNHIKNNDVYVSLFVKNFDWQYEDEQLFKIVGFVVESERYIYHSENDFTYNLFEKSMMLPSTLYDEVQEKPRYLKKNYLLNISKEGRDLFYYDDYLSNFIIEKTTYHDFPFWYKENTLIDDNLYSIYKKSESDLIPAYKIKWLIDNDYSFALNNQYYLKNNIISGFINELFITDDKENINYVEDNYFKSDLNGKIKINEDLNVVSGGLIIEANDTLTLDVDTINLKEGQIGISSKLLQKFPKSLQNSTIFVIGLVNRYQTGNKITKDYVKNTLKFDVVIENDEEYKIYGNQFIINSFFRDILGYEYEKYAGSAVNLITNEFNNDEIIKKYFYNFDVSKPFEEINLQINGIINILEIIMAGFSLIVILISIFLFSLIIKSFILDFKEDLHVLYCNGLSKKQIGKIFKKYIISVFLKASIFMLIFNIGMSVMIGFIVSQTLNSVYKFSISYISIITSLILAILMVFIGFMFVNNFIKKENIVISIRN